MVVPIIPLEGLLILLPAIVKQNNNFKLIHFLQNYNLKTHI